MNNFCVDLNLSINPLSVDVNTLPKLNYNKLDYKKYVNPELVDFFKSMSLELLNLSSVAFKTKDGSGLCLQYLKNLISGVLGESSKDSNFKWHTSKSKHVELSLFK